MSNDRLDIVDTVSGHEYTVLYIDYMAALREIERLKASLSAAINVAREAVNAIRHGVRY